MASDPDTDYKPKMTTDTLVDDSTSSETGPAGEYPRNWRYLGIPAPAAAPTSPSTTTLVTEVILNDANVSIFNAPDVDLLIDPPYLTDRNNYSTTLQPENGTGKAFNAGFIAGQEFRVTANSATQITLSGVDRIYTTLSTTELEPQVPGTAGWFLEELTTSAKQFATGKIRMPSMSITFAADHGLRTGDILRIREVVADWQSAVVASFPNVSGSQIAPTTRDLIFKTGTPGNVEFDVIRDESDIGNTVIDRSYI